MSMFTPFSPFFETKSELIEAEIQATNGSFLENIVQQPTTKTFISYVHETLGSNLSYSTDYIRNQWQIDMECKVEEGKLALSSAKCIKLDSEIGTYAHIVKVCANNTRKG